jgi:glycosyltransferase involved in cell wall biosynthesis
MTSLFLNALAASAGGGLTYVRNVIPHLSARGDVRATVLVNGAFRHELGNNRPNLELIEANTRGGVLGRFWFEERNLPQLIRRSGANVLLSAGNFALWNSPVPQILLSRNALYTSADFLRDLRRRGDYRLLLDTQLKACFAKASIGEADITAAPSEAFAQELREWTGKEVLAIHHGFDQEAFTRDQSPLPEEIQAQLEATEGDLRLLFVSHYNYYRNFETLLQAIPILKERFTQKVSLLLTCKLCSEDNPGSYAADSAKALVKHLGIEANVVELGSVPYGQLHHVYRAADIYVTPAYAESFAHPLVEAMSSGLPVIASDLAVHREICGNAALYFSSWCPDAMASRVDEIRRDVSLSHGLAANGLQRVQQFSWKRHVEQIIGVVSKLV